jgi:16S rRNA (cytosine967-C5)-methyltransferase
VARENEEVVRRFEETACRDFTSLEAVELLREARVERVDELVAGPYLRLWPHRQATDGFFAAAWQRR